MPTDDRLIEIMAELLAEVRQSRLENNERLDHLESKMAENTAAVVELHVSVLKTVENVEKIYNLDHRIKVIEGIILPRLSSLDNL